MGVRRLPCPTCGDDTDFVQPPCVDGHTEGGAECPEWACVACGTAIVTGGAAVLPVAAAVARAA
jgi:hypothetical protein